VSCIKIRAYDSKNIILHARANSACIVSRHARKQRQQIKDAACWHRVVNERSSPSRLVPPLAITRACVGSRPQHRKKSPILNPSTMPSRPSQKSNKSNTSRTSANKRWCQWTKYYRNSWCQRTNYYRKLLIRSLVLFWITFSFHFILFVYSIWRSYATGNR